MSAGFQVTKASLDQSSGAAVLSLENSFDDIRKLKAWLDSKTDAYLQGLGYDSSDVTLLRASFTDLDNLRKIASAQGTQGAPNDFFFNAGKLTGTN